MKMFKTLLGVSLISLLAILPCRAQTDIAIPANTQEYNPIVEMLDSLVTLNHVIRYNNLDDNNYERAEANAAIPTFSDQVYSERISQLNCPIPLSYNRYVKEFVQLYAEKKRSLTQRVMGLSTLYFPLYEQILDREGLPLEFKYLSVVESALNPVAVSRVGATGLWQFMYNTGLMYNLKINSYTDERRDPVKATEAACQYFKDMYAIYGDWLLVIASYNCGPGNVNRAIKRSGGKTNFWEIMPYLPKETRGYVPAFIAVTYVMNHAKDHNLSPVIPAYSYFEVDTVAVNQQVSLKVIARQLDLPLEVVSYLNPIYKKGIVPVKDKGMILRLPTNKIAQYIASESTIYAESLPKTLPTLPSRVSSRNDDLLADAGEEVSFEFSTKKVKKTHFVKKGETLGKIAARYDMSVNEVKKLNRLRSSTLHKGQKLFVYNWVKVKIPVKQVPSDLAKTDSSVKSGKDSATALSNGADSLTADSSLEEKEGQSKKQEDKQTKERFVYHLVQPGDTLWNIAQRYDGVTVEQIKDVNKLRNSQIKVGTKLKLIVNS